MLHRVRYAHRHVYLWTKKRQVDRFVAGARDCQSVQREVLLAKVRLNADCQFGREHHFPEIRSISDFRRQVPVTDYEYYRPYAERVKQGRIEAMFGAGTKVLMFSMTSGTTSQSKYIPITNHFFSEYRRSWNTWGLGTFRDHPDLLEKHTIHMGSDWQQFYTDGGIACGNISGLVAETRPWLSNPIFIVPPELNKVRGTADKQYALLRLTLPSRRVGMIGTANPLTLLNLARRADAQKEQLLRDLHDGTLSIPLEVPDRARQVLSRHSHRRHPDRVKELERVIHQTGHLYPKDFWPQLTVVSVWTGGTVGVYLPAVKEYYGNVTFRDHGLSASEGRMTTPLEDETSAGVLDYRTHYFEFIPEAEHDQSRPSVLQAHELEIGKDYYILLTTLSGLYRYDIHDVVRCVGFVGTCPVIDFLHKGAHFCSMAGEKLSEFQVTRAVPAALRELGLEIEHFTLAPRAGDPARYALLVEEVLDCGTTTELARRIDDQLSRVNCEYEDRLTSRRLGPVVVERVPRGTWDAYRRERLSHVGASEEAYKHPFLGNRPDFVERLRELAANADTEAADRCGEPRGS